MNTNKFLILETLKLFLIFQCSTPNYWISYIVEVWYIVHIIRRLPVYYFDPYKIIYILF